MPCDLASVQRFALNGIQLHRAMRLRRTRGAMVSGKPLTLTARCLRVVWKCTAKAHSMPCKRGPDRPRYRKRVPSFGVDVDQSSTRKRLVVLVEITDVGWALLPVFLALSRPRVANLRLKQQARFPGLRGSSYSGCIVHAKYQRRRRCVFHHPFRLRHTLGVVAIVYNTTRFS